MILSVNGMWNLMIIIHFYLVSRWLQQQFLKSFFIYKIWSGWPKLNQLVTFLYHFSRCFLHYEISINCRAVNMLVLVFVECSDHQLKYTQFKSEILAVQKSIKIRIRWAVIIPILKCVAQNQHVTPWNWKKIFPVTTMFI